MKKQKSVLLLAMFIIILLTACNSTQGDSSDNDSSKLYVFNWGEYIDPEVITMFEKETNINVEYDEYDTNETMYAKLSSGAIAYDIIFPSDYMIEKMISEDMLAEINLNNISNYNNIDERFKNLAYDPENKYSVPYMWGTMGILYNTTMVDEEVSSWDILWNEKYKDNILMQNSVRDAFAVALKKLGYSLNSTNENEVEEAKQLLIKQKPLVQAYVVDEVRDKMIGEEAALAVIWSGEAIITEQENENLKYVIPEQGSNMWFDAVAIPKISKNKEAAEKFIDFLCRPDIAVMNEEYIGYSTPNSAAKEQLPDDIKNNPAAYPSEDVLNNCEVFVDLKEANEMYNKKWNELKAE